MARAPLVQCPTCSAPVPWTEESRFRPFCSERCRTIDLGDWAAERRRIAGEPSEAPDEERGENPQ